MKKIRRLPRTILKDAEEDMQRLTDKYCKEAEQLFAKKEKEIMEI